MKTLVALTVLVVLVASQVEGHRNGWWSFFTCRCDRFFNPCRRNTGSKSIGCVDTNRYLQCTDQACDLRTCPTGQVWNKTASACAICPTGQHVSANNQRCVCDRGTTKNFKTGQCEPCPVNATLENDRCYCPSTLAFDSTSNTCRTCPDGSRLFFGGCRCTNLTMFWNEGAWACQPCPGTWEATRRSFWGFFGGRQRCTCNATLNQIFDAKRVRCYTCPSPTTAEDNCECDCPIDGQRFNMQTEVCECKHGRVLNQQGTACVKAANDDDGDDDVTEAPEGGEGGSQGGNDGPETP